MAQKLTPAEQAAVDAQVARGRAAMEAERQRKAELEAKVDDLEARGFNFGGNVTFGS